MWRDPRTAVLEHMGPVLQGSAGQSPLGGKLAAVPQWLASRLPETAHLGTLPLRPYRQPEDMGHPHFLPSWFHFPWPLPSSGATTKLPSPPPVLRDLH